MTRSRRWLLAAVLAPALPLSGQQIPGVAGDGFSAGQGRAEYYAEAYTTLSAMIGTWQAAWREDRLDRVTELYTENARLVAPHGATLSGRQQIRLLLAGWLAETDGIETTVEDFDASGGLAYVSGKFRFDRVREGVSTPVYGSYFAVFYRKGRNWLIRSQVFHPDPPAGG